MSRASFSAPPHDALPSGPAQDIRGSGERATQRRRASKDPVACWCLDGGGVGVRSELTGHTLVRNDDPDRFVLPTDADLNLFRRLADEAIAQVREAYHAKDHRPRQKRARGVLAAFENGGQIATRADALDYISQLSHLSEYESALQVRRVVCVLFTRLWAHDLLLWPQRRRWRDLYTQSFEPAALGKHEDWFTTLTVNLRATESREGQLNAQRLLLDRVLCVSGIQGVGDLTPETLGTQDFGHGFTRRRYELIRVAQTHAHPQQHARIHALWPRIKFGPQRVRNDPQFRWALRERPDLGAWVDAFQRYVATRTKKNRGLMFGDTFLRYLVANPGITADPSVYCDRHYRREKDFADESTYPVRRTRSPLLSKAHDFFSWYLRDALSLPDDFGRPVVREGYGNPITPISAGPAPAETVRQAMPVAFLREMIEILTEKNFAWPRRISADYFPRIDPTTGKIIRVWSPVRTIVLLLKLFLPLRTFQARSLESSEGDPLRYLLDAYGVGSWVRNEGEALHEQPRGVLRRFTEHNGRSLVGFFINTNKSQDRAPGKAEHGYEIPWEHTVVIRYLLQLEAFQREWNPIREPTLWSSLDEDCYRLNDDPRPGGAYFLARDPCSKRWPNQPVTNGRIQAMWWRLNHELQKRLRARGVRDFDNKPITLMEKVGPPNKRFYRSVYDLHTTRVTILTAMATEGGVPLPILSRCVAGHASVLMTLYYTKPSRTTVSEALDAASAKIESAEIENFQRCLRDRMLDGDRPDTLPVNAPPHGVVSGSSGLEALRTARYLGPELFSDIGLCPVGHSRCGDGGPRRSDGEGHEPVPGGDHNCVSCRFFVTGPAFLPGLVARFNGLSFSIQEVGARWRGHNQNKDRLEAALFDCQRAKQPFLHKNELARETSDFLLANAELDRLLLAWHDTHALITACRERLDEERSGARAGPGGLELVLRGSQADFSTALVEGSEWELLCAICESSVLHPVRETAAAVERRSRKLDALISAAGAGAPFAPLNPQESLFIGNQLVALMNKRLGASCVNGLMGGTRQLTADDRAGLQELIESRRALIANGDGLGGLAPMLPAPPAKKSRRPIPARLLSDAASGSIQETRA